MPTYYGYLRVSTEAQDVNSQKLGMLEYANRFGYAPLVWFSETVSRTIDWQNRELGALLEAATHGDIILISEVTRLASRPSQVFSFFEAAINKGVTVHVTKSNLVMDGGLQSQIMASVFSMASMIDIAFLRERTREGLQRARDEGRILGRPAGSVGRLKLDANEKANDEIRGNLALGLSKRKIALKLGVSYNTLKRFIERHKL